MFNIPGLELSAAPASAAAPRNYEAGVHRVSRVREAMRYGHAHGKPRGTSTYFRDFDAHWTHKAGEITLTTGYANHGKSEMMDELELIKSVHEPDKAWAVFSPENAPADEFYDSLVHKLTGYSPDPDWCRQYNRLQVSPQAYDRAMDWLEDHIIVINPPGEEKPTMECLLDYFDYVHGQTPLFGVRLDPWNQLFHEMKGQRDDQYLSEKLSDLARWTMQEDRPLCVHLVAHPRNPAKLKDGELPVPDQFDLSSGAMFGNKVWNVLTCHRPQYHVSKSDTSVQWWAHKIKKQKRVGRPGFIDLGYDYLSNRYMLGGHSPMEAAAGWLFKGIPLTAAGGAAESARVQANDFPEST
ncbi:hypothetical protein, partial [Hymenobacter lapidiphilus]